MVCHKVNSPVIPIDTLPIRYGRWTRGSTAVTICSVASQVGSVLAVLAVLAALAGAVAAVVRLRARRGIATAMQRATYDVLHTAALAAEPLRAGLTPANAGKAARHLRALVGAVGLTIADGERTLAFDGRGGHHSAQFRAAAERALQTHRS